MFTLSHKSLRHHEIHQACFYPSLNEGDKMRNTILIVAAIAITSVSLWLFSKKKVEYCPP